MEYNGYRITDLGTYAMVRIQPRGSGDIPAALDGLFTNTEFAMKAIDLYLSSLVKNRRKKTDDQKERTSSD